MSTSGMAVRATLAVCAAALAGCDKKMQITFANLTSESLDVQVTSPGGRDYVGMIPPMGRMEHGLRINKKSLPAVCSWTGGPYAGQFEVDKKTPKKLRIDIRGTEAPAPPQPPALQPEPPAATQPLSPPEPIPSTKEAGGPIQRSPIETPGEIVVP